MSAQADTQADRAQLIGSWVQNGGAAAWIIDSQTDGLHLTEIERSAPIADFQCNTEGHDCNVKIGGHKATVTLYYNGPALVQLETIGDQVVKRRFTILPSGNAMKVEVMPMSGHAPNQQLEFERGQPSVQKK
jgi:hypothetical protein